MGHPILREMAKEVSREEIQSVEFRTFLEDMYQTMKDANGIGLAAPQVHVAKQVALIEFSDDNSRYPDMGSQNLLVIINPKITVLDQTLQSFWEGCLSVPGLRGKVARPRKIRVDYLDQNAEAQSIEAEDFLATVFQHEIDHLFASLYVDKVIDSKHLVFIEEYQRYILPLETGPEV